MQQSRIRWAGAGLATIALTLVLAGATSSVHANTYGSDTDLTQSPAQGGLVGGAEVRPQDPVSAVFGNPATMTQWDHGTAFNFGASYINLQPRNEHAGLPGATLPFDVTSDTNNLLLPHVGVVQRVTDKLTLGGGFQLTSGLPSDFREAEPLSPVVTYFNFGANASGAYEITDRWAVGGGVTLAAAFLEVGLLSNTSIRNGFGVSGAVGTTFDTGPVILGATYTSPQSVIFEDVVETAPGEFSNLELQQPQSVTVSLATTDALSDRWFVALDGQWKNWGDAETYEDVWQDTFGFTVSGQYDFGPVRLRAGYGFTSDLQRDDVGSSLGGIETLAFEGAAVPLSPPLIEFVQSTLTQPFWQQRIGFGVGLDLTEQIGVDAFFAYAFDGDRTIGEVNELTQISTFAGGVGLTWRFGAR